MEKYSLFLEIFVKGVFLIHFINAKNYTCEDSPGYRRFFATPDTLWPCQIENIILEAKDHFVLNINNENVTNINELQILDGQLDYLPNEIWTYLPHLQYIVVKETHLKVLEEGSFKGAKNLKRFLGDGNLLTHIPKNTFKGTECLDRLWLKDNLISSIDKDAFSGLEMLTILMLENNSISDIGEFLAPLKSLKHFGLRDNKVVKLSAGNFKFNGKMEFVDLTDNKVNIVDPNVFCYTKKLIGISLSGNVCDNSDYYGGMIFHLELNQCYDNFYESEEFLSKKVTKFEYYTCFMELIDDHAKTIYEHLFGNFHKNSTQTLNSLSEKQDFILTTLCCVIICLLASNIFMVMRFRKMTSDKEAVKMSDLEELISS